MFNQHTKFEVSMITCYEDMKGNAKCRNCGGLEWLGVTQGHRQCRHSIELTQLLIAFIRNYASTVYHFQVIESYLSKVANFKFLTYLTCIWHLCWG